MSSEFLSVLVWYGLFLLLGWSVFPLTYTLFRHLPDRGYALAKTLGLFLLAYVLWLAVNLKITAYTRGALFGTLIILWGVNSVLLLARQNALLQWMRANLWLILLTEAIFWLFFMGALLIRMYSPELTGAEKEADFTFLNAILHSRTFPPKDTWFVGESINYYYFGYLIWASVIKLTGVIAPVGFNIALAATAALAAIGAFSLGYAFTRRVSDSLLSPLCLLVFANLDGLVQIFQRQGKLLPFNWWQSSRVIPDTINEFPFFSFILGDLHAHFMAIPFGLLVLGMIYQAFAYSFSGAAGEHPPLSKRWTGSVLSRSGWGYRSVLLLLLALLLGGAAVINTWDYPTYLILTAVCLGIGILHRAPIFRTERPQFIRWGAALGILAALLVFSRLLFWPFYQHFTAQLTLSSLRFVALEQRTALKYFLIIYGVFLWMLLVFLWARFRQLFTLPDGEARLPRLVAWSGLGVGLMILYLIAGTWVFPITCLFGGIFLYLCLKDPARAVSEQFPYLLVFLALAIVAGCEIVYIKDFYGHPLERQNTIFKFHYQAWIFLAVGAPALWRLALQHLATSGHQHVRRWCLGIMAALCGACCIYPIFGLYERAYHFKGAPYAGRPYPSLNGINYIALRYPFEYEALQWIQAQISEDAVILEATGKPYSFFGRVATVTGRSTVLGWGNHESLWRGQTWEAVTQRTEDIKQIYDTVDKAQIQGILAKYQITHIYVGQLERETYTKEGLEAFARSFPVAYQNAGVTIYTKS